ncbi:MAG: FliH/SctL family protein [Planctomycetota bacterium]
MAVLKRADAENTSVIALDLGDLADQGRRIRQRAQAEAQEIRARAKSERKALIADAAEKGHREGFEKGRVEGFEQGREQGRTEAKAEATARLQTLDAAWARALEAMNASQQEWNQAARAGVMNLALEIARRVTGRVVEIDHRAVEGPLESALSLVGQGTRAVICVNPVDEDAVRDALPRLARRLDTAREAELEIDEAVSRGSCVIRTATRGFIDADIETQLERICDALRPPEGADQVSPIDGAEIDIEADEAADERRDERGTESGEGG